MILYRQSKQQGDQKNLLSKREVLQIQDTALPTAVPHQKQLRPDWLATRAACPRRDQSDLVRMVRMGLAGGKGPIEGRSTPKVS